MQINWKRFGQIFPVFALIISIILNILFRKELFQLGVNFIYSYQTSSQSDAITVIQNLISILGNTFFIVAFLIVVHLLAYRKLATIVYIFFIVLNAYLIGVEKQAHQDPRPFFYNAKIQALEWTCPKSYGFPSGHSWMSVLLYQPVISDFIGTKGWKKIILVWILLTGTLIPLSRQYLGSHTADQVTTGVLHSMLALMLYKNHTQKKIYNFFIKIVKGIQLSKTLVFTTIGFLISIAVPFIIYSINVNHKIFDPNYLALMNSTCNKNYTQVDLDKEAGLAATIIGLVFGFIYGFVMVNHPKFSTVFNTYNEGRPRNVYLCYLKGDWNFRGQVTNGLKYIIFYIIFGGIFIGALAFGIPASFNNFYGAYILQTLGYCLFGISIVCFIPFILVKLQSIECDPLGNNGVQEEVKTSEQVTPKGMRNES